MNLSRNDVLILGHYFLVSLFILGFSLFIVTENTKPDVEGYPERGWEIRLGRPLDIESEDIESYPKIEVVATGYYAGVKSTGKNPGHPQYGITYSGVKVRRDLYSTIAADPNVFPLGTILYIPNYGYGVVADTGSAIKGHKIDLYFETLEDVYREWGKRTVQVVVIKEGDGLVTEALLDELNRSQVTILPELHNNNNNKPTQIE